MKKSILTFALISLLSAHSSAQVKMYGVTLSPQIAPAKTTLTLNGGGVRTKYFIKVYVAGLYLQNKSSNPKEIIDADKPMSVRIHIISNLMTSANMAVAIREGFDKSCDGNVAPFKKQIDDICSIFQSDVIKVGDLFEIFYTPGVGVRAYKNNKLYDITMVGLPFKKALFGIWLSEDPVDLNLKKGMLGL